MKGAVKRSTVFLLLSAFFLLSILKPAIGQGEKKYIREGNREYAKNNFQGSEISYRRAMDKNKSSADAVFNTGDALYRQKKFEEAGNQFNESIKMNDDKAKKSASLYNLGNSLLMNKKISESIEAYKNSLKLDPGNLEAKYNLAYAQDLLSQQQQQKQQQDKQQPNQDNKDQQEEQNKKNDEQNENNQDREQNNNQGNQNDDDQQQQQQDQQQNGQQEITREDAERLLNALANDEKNIQEKVKLEKAAKTRVKTLKNW